MNDSETRQQIESEKESVRDPEGWRRIIFEGKVMPHIGSKGRKAAEIVAAWVALNGVKKARLVVLAEANAGNNEFFVALGRCLSGKRKRLWDKVDETIARNWKRILLRKSRKEGALWMQKHGFPSLTYDGYRQRLVSLGLTTK